MLDEALLISKVDEFPSSYKEEYIKNVKEYINVKKDLDFINQPIESENIIVDLRKCHLNVVDSTLNMDMRKKSLLDSIRLYKSIVCSNEELNKFINNINLILDEDLDNYIKSSLMHILKYESEDYNLSIGLLKSYYDTTKLLAKHNLNSNIMDNVDFWAYVNLEDSILKDIKSIDCNKLNKIIMLSKKITTSYIIALYDSSRIVFKLSTLEENINNIKKSLEAPELLIKRVDSCNKILKTGNGIVAYENNKKDNLDALKIDLNEFNDLILNLNR